MPATHTTTYVIPEDKSVEEVLETLRRRLSVRPQATPGHTLTFYDTFDWRLYRDGGSLAVTPVGKASSLLWAGHGGAVRHRLCLGSPPGFVWDLPPGPCRDALAPVLQMRRLLPMVKIRHRGRLLRVLDGEQKTVARLYLDQDVARAPSRAAAAQPLPPVLRLAPVRGYDADHDRVGRVLEKNLALPRADGTQLSTALAAIGRWPGELSSKVRIDLEPAMPAARAARAIHKRLLEVIELNEDGTRRDLDSEFLHDFRVSVRRTRAALSQIKEVHPPAALEHFRREFSWLGSLTGPTRDLDVYLLKMPAYRASLPAAVQDDLAPLTEFLHRRQRQEQRRLARQLGSSRYRRLLEDWHAFLAEEDCGTAPNAAMPIGELASQRIWKVYRRVLRRGGAIEPRTPAEAVHDLRLDCKKLRYLLEFFRSLYDAALMDRLIRALKRLQDNLGDFNDYEIQQTQIRHFAEQMAEQGTAPAATLMAMGRLVARLERGQAEERQRFSERFPEFAREKNRQHARALFASRG